MACNVYGTPVTDATLKGMTKYHKKTIEAVDRARVALDLKNAEGKDIAARNFADQLQEEDEKKGVRCLIYNATGGPLKLVADYRYTGYVSMSPVPPLLQNGQWASFVHEKDDGASNAAVVYESLNDGDTQWALGWSQKDNVVSKCYSETIRGGYSVNSSNETRETLRRLIDESKAIHSCDSGENVILSAIGNTALPIFEAIMTKTRAFY